MPRACARERNHELSILNAIAEALNREVDLDRALHVTLAQVADRLDWQTGWIWLPSLFQAVSSTV